MTDDGRRMAEGGSDRMADAFEALPPGFRPSSVIRHLSLSPIEKDTLIPECPIRPASSTYPSGSRTPFPNH